METSLWVTLTHVECYKCRIVFGMTSETIGALRSSHASFYCPNGHRQYFAGETEEERLKRRLDIEETRAKQLVAELDKAERSVIAYRGRWRGAKKKLAKVEKGTCPHCRRHFKDLRRHMATKHSKHTH